MIISKPTKTEVHLLNLDEVKFEYLWVENDNKYITLLEELGYKSIYQEIKGCLLVK